MVTLEGRQSWKASGLQTLTFSTQELTSKSSALSADHRGDDCPPEAQSSLPEHHEDGHTPKTDLAPVSQNNTEFSELKQVSVIPNGAHQGLNPLELPQHDEAGIASTLTTTNYDISLPVPVAEGQSDQMVQSHAVQTEDLNSRCAKTDFTEPVSNGHVLLDLPRIVKYKPSSITFSHHTCPSAADSHAFVNESSDDGESSPGEDEDDSHDDGDDDDDDDVVFPELPPSREVSVNHRQRSKDKQKRRGATSAQAEIDHTARSCGYEAEEESCSKEVCCY